MKMYVKVEGKVYCMARFVGAVPMRILIHSLNIPEFNSNYNYFFKFCRII